MNTQKRIEKMLKKTEPILQAGRKLPTKNQMQVEILKMGLAINTICRVYGNCYNCPLFVDGLCIAGPDEIPTHIKEKVYAIIESEVH